MWSHNSLIPVSPTFINPFFSSSGEDLADALSSLTYHSLVSSAGVSERTSVYNPTSPQTKRPLKIPEQTF